MALDFASNSSMLTVGSTPNIIQSAVGSLAVPQGVPAFAAWHTTTQAQNTVLVFNTALYNRGNFYNPATGIFTAQTKGIYHLKASVAVPLTAGDWRVYIPTTAGTTRQTIFYQNYTTSYQALTVEAVLNMNVNDYAYVIYTGPTSINILNGTTINHFHGHMVV